MHTRRGLRGSAHDAFRVFKNTNCWQSDLNGERTYYRGQALSEVGRMFLDIHNKPGVFSTPLSRLYVPHWQPEIQRDELQA